MVNVNDTNDSAANDTARALAAGVRRLRQQQGLTQRQVAAEMVAAGCRDWTAATVANAERLDKPRALAVGEIAGLCVALRCSIDALLADSPAALERLYGQWGEAVGTPEWTVAVADARRHEVLADLVSRLAGALGVTDSDVHRIARDLYGRDVLVERDARVAGAPPGDPRDRARRLGHATRAIRDELAEYLAGQDLDPEPF